MGLWLCRPHRALRLPGKRLGVVEMELKFFFRAAELMVEPSRSCKKFKTRRDFPRLHPLSKRLMAR